MADQVEIVGKALEFLRLIEAHTKAASSMVSRSGKGDKAAIAGGRKENDTIKATAKALSGVGDAADDVEESLRDLNKTLAKSVRRLGTFNSKLASTRVRKTNITPSIDLSTIATDTSALEDGFNKLSGEAHEAGLGLRFFNSPLTDATKGLGRLSILIASSVRVLRSLNAVQVTATKTQRTQSKIPGPPPGPRTPPTPANTPSPALQPASLLGRMFTGLIPKGVGLGSAFLSLTTLIRGSVMDAFNDVFRLQARGISAQGNLIDFYKSAAVAGMSLQEYTQLLEENRVAVARSGSFAAFNKRLESSTDALAGMGVFGKAAREMSGQILSSGTMLGVPQQQLDGVMQQQIAMFNELRKTTGLTADGFTQLIKDVSENSNVQGELLGLAPSERAARMMQLAQTRALGETMGLTKENSKALGDALLAQRSAMATDRFKGMGTVRQAGAITGMDATRTDELAKLSMKKTKTTEENLRQAILAGELESKLQRMENSSDIGTQNIAEQLRANMPSYMQTILNESGKLGLATDSAKPEQLFKDGTGTFLQAVGKFATLIEGLTKNPLWDLLKGISGILVGAIAAMGAGKLFSKMSGGAAAKAAVSAGATAGSSVGSMLSTVISTINKPLVALKNVANADLLAPLKSAASAIAGAGKPVMSVGRGFAQMVASGVSSVRQYGNAVKLSAAITSNGAVALDMAKTVTQGAWRGITSATSAGVSATASGVGKLVGFFGKAGPLSFVFGAFEELFTGEMTKALDLGDGIFARLMGAVIAGFNGIFTGISRLFDDSVNWLLEGLGFDMKVNTTKFFDYITGGIVDGFKTLGIMALEGLATMIESIMGIFGKKAPFVKTLRDSADQLVVSLGKSSENRERMFAEEGGTLRKEGAKQVEAAKKTAEKVTAEVKKTTDANGEVVFGLANLVPAAQATVSQIQAEAESSQAAVASPGQTARQNVNQSGVNKPQTEETQSKPEGKSMPQTIEGMATAVQLLQQQLDTAKLILEALTNPQRADPFLLPRNVSFADNASMLNNLIGTSMPKPQ